jgi:hypothetical protein
MVTSVKMNSLSFLVPPDVQFVCSHIFVCILLGMHKSKMFEIEKHLNSMTSVYVDANPSLFVFLITSGLWG